MMVKNMFINNVYKYNLSNRVNCLLHRWFTPTVKSQFCSDSSKVCEGLEIITNIKVKQSPIK